MNKQSSLIILSLIALYLVLTRTFVGDLLLDLFLLGRVPGTSRFIPAWFMMVVYCGAITVLVTHYIESTFKATRKFKATQLKQDLPRRYRRS